MKRLKKVVSALVATVMAMSSLVTSVGAEGNITNAEVAFSLKYLDSLPKEEDANFDEFLKLPDIDQLEEKRVSVVKHMGSDEEKISFNEKEVFQQICNEVDKIENKVDGKTTSEDKDTPKGDETNANLDKPRNWRIARAIYDWVIDNIEYDFESIQKDEKGKESFRKFQDALFVYHQKMGVCVGKASLVALMMRMAGIPCVCVGTEKHAYNAIYLKSDDVNCNGWTLLDSTWGAPVSDYGYVEEAYHLIKGRIGSYKEWVKDRFNIDNEYAEAIGELTLIPYNTEVNEKVAKKFNDKIERELPELNKKFNNDFKFTNIKCVIEQGQGGNADYFNLEYKTDLAYCKAEQINNEVKEKSKINFIETQMTHSCCLENEGKLSEPFKVNYFEKSKQNGKSNDESKKYIEELGDIFSKILKEYKNNNNLIEKNIHKVNQDIKSKIEELNNNFKDKDVVKVELDRFEINHYAGEEYDEVGCPIAHIKYILDRDYVKKMIESEYIEKNIKNKEKHFPGFYNDKLSFRDINKNMIKNVDEGITFVYSPITHNKHNDKPSLLETSYLIINGIVYDWWIKDGKPYIEVRTSNLNESRENVELESEIANLGVPLKIGSGIRSLKLTGDQEVDILGAANLESVDVSKSNKYGGYDVKNRRLIDKADALKSELNSKCMQWDTVRQDFEESGISVFEIDNDDISKCFEAAKDVYNSNCSFDQLKNDITIINNAIEYVKQKVTPENIDLLKRFCSKEQKYNDAVDTLGYFHVIMEDHVINKEHDNIIIKCREAIRSVRESKYAFEKLKEAEKLIDSAMECINQYNQKCNSDKK